MAEDRKQPGDPLRIKARTWNRLVEAGDYYQEQQRLGRGSRRANGSTRTDTVKVQNDSGADRALGEVLEIATAPLLDKLEAEYLWFGGEAPTLTCKVWGVLREPVKSGKPGTLQLSGVCRAKVNINDSAHKRARVVKGQHELESGHYGEVPIVWKPESDTGSQLCAVLLTGDDPGEVYVGKLNEALSQGGSATVTRWVRNSAGTAFEASSPAITDTVEDWLMKPGDADISSGKKLTYERERCSGVLVVTGVECE